MADRGIAFTPTLVPELRRLSAAEAVAAVVEDSLGLLDPRRRSVSDRLLAYGRLQATLDKYDTPLDWPPIISRVLGYTRAMHEAGVMLLAGTDFGARLVRLPRLD